MGTLAAQLIHAAGESSTGDLPPETHAIALSVPSESELLALEQRLIAAGLPHHAIREPDEPWNGALMAIGIRPCTRAQAAPHLSNLRLLR